MRTRNDEMILYLMVNGASDKEASNTRGQLARRDLDNRIHSFRQAFYNKTGCCPHYSQLLLSKLSSFGLIVADFSQLEAESAFPVVPHGVHVWILGEEFGTQEQRLG